MTDPGQPPYYDPQSGSPQGYTPQYGNAQWGGNYTVPPPGYGPYPYPVGPPPQNGAGVAALVMGIMSFASSCLPLAIPAVICGHIGVNRAKRGEADNLGLAKAGLIMGYIGCGFMVAIVLFYVLFFVFALGTAGMATNTN